MKHAKRMVLVPEDTLQRYEQRQRLETSPIMANMMHKDTDMSNILQRTDMDDDEKQKLYYANLERYMDLRRQKDSQIPTVRIAPGAESKEKAQLPDATVAQLPDATIVGHIPKTMRERATLLLNRLKTRPDVISWDETGQVKLEGETIPQSNISDLVSDAMRARKHFNPTGSKEFFRVLSKINMPKDLVRNEQRWKQVDNSSGGEDVSYRTPQRTTPPSSYFQTLLRKHQGPQAQKSWISY